MRLCSPTNKWLNDIHFIQAQKGKDEVEFSLFNRLSPIQLASDNNPQYTIFRVSVEDYTLCKVPTYVI